MPAPAPALSSQSLLFSFGSIADVQFCDKDDGTDFSGQTPRYYRGSLACLHRAVEYWGAVASGLYHPGSEQQPGLEGGQSRPQSLAFIAQLGDIIDGFCRDLGQSEADMRRVLEVLEGCNSFCDRVVHLIGNHELYNLASLGGDLHPWLQTRSNVTDPSVEYHSFNPVNSIRIIVLNSFHLSTMLPKGTPEHGQAQALMDKYNPNDLSRPCNFSTGLSGLDQRWVPYNGGLGEGQLAWLAAELQEAKATCQTVIILSHVPLHPEASQNGARTVIWDYDAALALIRDSGCVAAVLSGHNHKGGYCIGAEDGVHHVTFQSPLNKGDAGNCYGHVDVYPDRLVIAGPNLPDHVGPELHPACSPRGGAAAAVDAPVASEDSGDGGGLHEVTLPFPASCLAARRAASA